MRESIVSKTRQLGHRRPVFRMLLDRAFAEYRRWVQMGARDNTCAALVVVAKPK